MISQNPSSLYYLCFPHKNVLTISHLWIILPIPHTDLPSELFLHCMPWLSSAVTPWAKEARSSCCTPLESQSTGVTWDLIKHLNGYREYWGLYCLPILNIFLNKDEKAFEIFNKIRTKCKLFLAVGNLCRNQKLSEICMPEQLPLARESIYKLSFILSLQILEVFVRLFLNVYNLALVFVIPLLFPCSSKMYLLPFTFL